jgi:hypothetical protein
VRLGFLAGFAVPLFFITALSNPSVWILVLLVGAVLAIVPLALAVIVYEVLKSQARLRLWWAVLVGAVLCPLPVVAINLMAIGPNGSQTLAAGEWVLVHGQYTPAGIWHYFIVQPAMYGLAGALGGIVGWLIAFGPRVKAPMREN